MQIMNPLTDAEIMRVAPSVFAEGKHENRSERYSYIPTIHAINELRKEGFEVFKASQSRSRTPGMEGHTKHMLRLRHKGDYLTKYNTPQAGCNEIGIINSHNGSSQWHMFSGHYVLVCSNGLTTSTDDTEIRIRHSQNQVGRVIEGVYSIVNQFAELDENREQMKALMLQNSQINEFARQALTFKYKENAPFDASRLLVPRRFEDADSSLWSVYNRVQENLIKGGISGRNANGRRVSTRAIRNIDADFKINSTLWGLAKNALAGNYQPVIEAELV